MHYRKPFRVLILNNKLVGFEHYDNIELTSERIYRFLYKIYLDKNTRKAIPKELLDHFETIPQPLQKLSYPCLSGDFYENPCTVCFVCKMDIIDRRLSSKIRLYDLADINRDEAFYKFDYHQEVLLSPKEAFFIFANITTENILLYGRDAASTFKGTPNPAFALRTYLQNLSTIPNYNEKRTKEITHYSLNFSADYLQYLQNKLANGEITPVAILRDNGVGILGILSGIPVVKQFILEKANTFATNHHSLSMNEKILYYTLIMKCLKDLKVLYQEIIEFFTFSVDYILKIETELTKKFPNYLDDIKVQPVEDERSLFEKYNFQK